MRDVVGSFEWEVKYNPRQPCLGTGCTLQRNFGRTSKEARREGGGKVGFFFNIVASKHFPSISPIGGQPDQLCKDPPVHLNGDRLKMFQIGSTKTLFLTKSPSQNIVKARVIALVLNDKIAVTLKCVVLCSAAKPEKCEICLAGFPANDGANLRELLIISLPAEPVCENYQLPASYTKTCSNAIHV